MSITSLLVKAFVPTPERTSDPDVRQRYGALEAWVSIVVNTLMAALKFALGLWINSVALIADAGHTLSDTLTSVVVLVGFCTARRPVDREHPHGHGRMESIATLIIATLLAVVGIEFLVQSVHRLIAPAQVRVSYLAVVAMLFSALIKEWMARFSIDLGRRIRSSALTADAWHHRSDAVASFLVALAILGAAFDYTRLDGVFGIAVSLLILYTGIDLIRSSASYLIGESPDAQTLAEVRNAAQSVPGVVSLHDIEMHDYGQHKDVSLHIEVNSASSVIQAHAIAQAVEDAVNRRLQVSTVVHVDPLGETPPSASAGGISAIVESVLAQEPDVTGYHALTVSGNEAGARVVHFHVTLDGHTQLARSHEISHRLNRLVSERLPGCSVTIHMEPTASATR
jgi:cation diffusion facilitator family transporter